MIIGRDVNATRLHGGESDGENSATAFAGR